MKYYQRNNYISNKKLQQVTIHTDQFIHLYHSFGQQYGYIFNHSPFHIRGTTILRIIEGNLLKEKN